MSTGQFALLETGEGTVLPLAVLVNNLPCCMSSTERVIRVEIPTWQSYYNHDLIELDSLVVDLTDQFT